MTRSDGAAKPNGDRDALGATLSALGLGQYAEAFASADINLDILPLLTEDDLKELGLSLGHRRKLLAAVASGALMIQAASSAPAPAAYQPSGDQGGLLRQVTVLYCDLVGSTELTQSVEPEVMGGILRLFKDTVARAITDFDGYIDHFMGDGVLAFFGYPSAYEDAAERAVRAGLAMLAGVAKIPVPRPDKLAARVAVASGTVFFGEILQHGGAREPIVSGEVTNLVSRMQTVAPVNSLVVSASTRRLLRELFHLTDLGVFEFKGISRPVQAWRVDRERAGGTRFEVSHGAKALPIAGREAEIGLLRERWQSACTGEGQVVLLSGEAGMGKSRIVQELRHAAETVPHFALRYQCSPFHRNSALYPITAQLRMGCGIEDTDPPAVRLNKVRLLAAQAGTASEADIRLLDSLLSMPAAGNDATPALTAEEFKRDVLRVLLAQLLGLAAQKPVLMLFEDAHWMDPTTIEVVSETLMHIPSARVLIVITYRPDFKADWANAAHVTTLALSGLPRRHVLAIIDRVAGKKLPDELVELIIANTDGIPLFVEELTKTALELGIVHERNGRFELASPKATLTIPITLQDSLLARLDRHPAIKELAQVAAVIGREFSMDHLSALASSKGETLQAGIRELLRAELVHQRGGADRGTFIFKHALIQEAAYRTLIGARRQGLHARFAEFLLGLSTEFGETPPEVIAHHFTEAHQPERAIPYWLKAGQNAARRSANVEAIAHLRQGLQLIPQLADPAGQLACELRLQTEIGVPLIATHGYAAPETMVAWERTRALAEQLGEDAPLLRATYGLWAARMSAGQTRMALALSNRLIETGERTGDTGVRIVGLRVRGLTMHAMAEMPQARADLETAVSAYNPDQHSQLGLKFGQNPRMAANAILATVLWGEGRPNQARQLSLATVDEAVAFGHTNTLAYVLAYGACVVAMLRGDTAETERLADQLIAVARNNRLFLWEAYGEAYKGWAIRKAPGQADEAMRLLERSRNGFQRAGSALYQPLFDAIIASQLGLAGRCSDAVQRLRDAVEETERREELWCLPELLRLQARLVSCIGETAQAGDLLERALQVAREHRLLGWSLRVACDIARRLRDAGDHGRIAPLLQPIMDEFPEPEHTADWRRALALLADGGAYAARRETSSTAGSTNV